MNKIWEQKLQKYLSQWDCKFRKKVQRQATTMMRDDSRRKRKTNQNVFVGNRIRLENKGLKEKKG